MNIKDGNMAVKNHSLHEHNWNNSLQCHFIQNHLRWVHIRLAVSVTCHLHFWQKDRGLLLMTVVTRGWNRYQKKGQQRKLTLERKILQPGFESTTFRSSVWHSTTELSLPLCSGGICYCAVQLTVTHSLHIFFQSSPEPTPGRKDTHISIEDVEENNSCDGHDVENGSEEEQPWNKQRELASDSNGYNDYTVMTALPHPTPLSYPPPTTPGHLPSTKLLELLMSLKGHSISLCICPPMLSVPNERLEC